MRLFDLLGFQHIILFFFPTLVFLFLFALSLAYSHFLRKDSDMRREEIIYVHPDQIEDRNAPFPLALTLIIAGTVIWAFFYILVTGLLGVKI
jgi:uncharacterized membrane protein YidH (DUF202 family)